jgi:hypothetical protein
MCGSCCKFVKLTPDIIHLIYGDSHKVKYRNIVGSITNVEGALPLLDKDASDEEWELYRSTWGPKILELEEVLVPDNYWTTWQNAGKHLYRRL